MKNLTVKEFRDNLALYLHLPVDTIIQVSGACWKRVHASEVQIPVTIEKPIDERQTDVYMAIKDNAVTCDRCKKNPPQRKIEEDGENYKVCESCLRKSFPLSRIKRLPLWKPE